MIISPEQYCSTVARAMDIQLFGSAPEADVWIMLEYTGAWGRDAFAESDLPAEVKAHIEEAQKAIPRSRLQLIKQDPPYDLPNITLAIAICRESDPALYVFEFEECASVTSLDFLDVVVNEEHYKANRVTDSMVLICTNAKRDRCCAVRGLPTYSQLVEVIGTSVWRTTHLGGHRFGATGVVLPHGLVYGQLDDVDLDAFAADVVSNRIHLHALRGRSLYAPELQAAEFYLREETQVFDAEAYRVLDVDEIGENQWDVHFAEINVRIEHVIGVARTRSDKEIIPSCGKEPEQVLEHQIMYHHIVVAE